MTLNSIPFFVFLGVTAAVYWRIKPQHRWISLLAASYAFYLSWRMDFVLILVGITLITYGSARRIAAAEDRKVKKCWLWAGILLSLAVLFAFKYTGFTAEIMNQLGEWLGLAMYVRGLDLVYPIGLSFLVFQAIGYLLDVTHEKIPAEAHLGHFAVYTAFFPKLLMGPIERYDHFSAQLQRPPAFSSDGFIEGGLRIAWGLFKKLVVVNRLAVIVDTVFAGPINFSSVQLLFAIFAYAFQVYLDFASYTDIALGAAKMLGFDLIENFHQPYLARSVTEFWRRWHISLSTWLRDYIFFPLNFKHRRKKPAWLWTSIDLMITFLLSGLWHGANWTYIVWGFLHGLYQSAETLAARLRKQIKRDAPQKPETIVFRWMQRLGTFLLVSLAWVFFRVDTVRQGYGILRLVVLMENMLKPESWLFGDGKLGLLTGQVVWLLHALIAVLLLEYLQSRWNLYSIFRKQPAWFRWTGYLALVFGFLVLGWYGQESYQQFIYSQF